MQLLRGTIRFLPHFCGKCAQSPWEGFLLAFGLGLAINTGAIAIFAWQQGLATGVPGLVAATGWVLVLGFLVLSSRFAAQRKRVAVVADPETDTVFRDAQHEYLRNHWLEAETLIKRLLKRRPQDVESLLLLASIQRRTQQVSEARRTLVKMSNIPAAAHWLAEMETERKLVDQLAADASPQALLRKAA